MGSIHCWFWSFCGICWQYVKYYQLYLFRKKRRSVTVKYQKRQTEFHRRTQMFWKSIGYNLHSNASSPSPCLIIALNLCHFVANIPIYWAHQIKTPSVRQWRVGVNKSSLRTSNKHFNELTKVKLFCLHFKNKMFSSSTCGFIHGAGGGQTCG